MENKDDFRPSHGTSIEEPDAHADDARRHTKHRFEKFKPLYTAVCILLLLINYFLSQFDK